MGRTLVVILLLVMAFAVAFAPAALIRHALPGAAGIELVAPAGTLWNGQALALIDGRSAGTIGWRMAPVTLLQGALGYHIDLDGPGHAIEAQLRLRPATVEIRLQGGADANAFNDWLSVYEIQLSGHFTFDNVTIKAPYRLDQHQDLTGAASGTLTWSGGTVHYRLAAEPYRGDLPPLEATFGAGLEAIVRARGNATPLLFIGILNNGHIRLGMTKLLTKMLNNPWPGREADHEVVLEVEEQLL